MAGLLSSLLGSKRRDRVRVGQSSTYSSPYLQSSPAAARRERMRQPARYASADFTESDMDDEMTDDDAGADVLEVDPQDEPDDEFQDEDDHEDGRGQPLLPVFSATHLDGIPIYNLTHAIRLIILPRTDTVLTWDQLRSPQVSQFLLKPMQQQIRASHFSRATLYALMANCLQFRKESQANPAVAGNSNTRAMVCELLALKLLKEYGTRELIDALSFDFWPLQGLTTTSGQVVAGFNGSPKPAAARTSALEVAIRALAKKFLAHPQVVKQLEAIWAGNIVFHSASDNLHRPALAVEDQNRLQRQQHSRNVHPIETSHLRVPQNSLNYGAMGRSKARKSTDKVQSANVNPLQARVRRTVTLYDPRDASLFKLSRLRVPRYRQLFSTCSLAVLLFLFLAVLIERSTDITMMEIIFWLWSAGFMLDEVVGFNEQGFSLYLMSFWNLFDVGILMLLMLYYCMRLYGLFLVDHGRDEWNSMAYDVLATNAILLFPRLFSVLDHYRYFSQLLIAFRLMAIDLVAVFILITIVCSGFFVAFTLSFGTDDYSAAEVAYKIFQIVMGFTPAAWDAWDHYNLLGKAILTAFLFLCHFLFVTILITVLTNSFMAIVSNANEEHQFVFAVNTISMVKSAELFSYVAPSNILAWVLAPLMFVMPFPTFVKLNRTIIKITHFALLLGIYAYERLILASSVFNSTDLIEKRGHRRMTSLHNMQAGLFSPAVRTRQESFESFQKDNALEEVFRHVPQDQTLHTMHQTSDVSNNHEVRRWMARQDESPYNARQGSLAFNQPEKRQRYRKSILTQQLGCDGTTSHSIASDPVEFVSFNGHDHYSRGLDSSGINMGYTDQDGDDELERSTARMMQDEGRDSDEGGHFWTPNETRIDSQPSNSIRILRQVSSKGNFELSPASARLHRRNHSAATILFNPVSTAPRPKIDSSASPPKSQSASRLAGTGSHTPGIQTSRHSIAPSKPRPIIASRREFQKPSDNTGSYKDTRRLPFRRRSSLDMGVSETDLAHDDAAMLTGMPGSFATQMAIATGGVSKRREDSEAMMGRLMLARMKALEEAFREVVKEVRDLGNLRSSTAEEPTDGS